MNNVCLLKNYFQTIFRISQLSEQFSDGWRRGQSVSVVIGR